MLTEYIEEALKRAKYEIIDDEEPYYGEVPELKGVWASGKTLEECRKKLKEVIEGWLILSIKKGLSIPKLGSITVEDVKMVRI
ncbi:MAG: HicB family protein [Candidatus Infernicultor aquiphilus]|uniref:HicB family protein n=1 Tax=Candidatus Infernicultor aquiphilus TaxID=1805029 RepID=A0A2M7PR03_9BACT|nr:MAG: HicB family protein [Candidatus Atribacteria bacterium CG_4_10_14_3_um_filter_34_13]